MAYPIQELTPTATDQDKQAALQATMEQLISEGKTPEEAQQMVIQMVQQLQSMTSRSTQMQRHTATGFASGGDGGGGSNSMGMQNVSGLNRSFTNFRPMQLPPGGNSPGYQRYNG